MKQCFTPKRFKSKAMDIIVRANIILDEYKEAGYDLSLRQLYYQFVARDWLPNNDRSYKNLGWMVSDARLAGLIDWDMLTDRSRQTYKSPSWENPEGVIRSAAYSLKLDKWKDQDYHVELMVEKQALEGVLLPVCGELDIHFTSNRGYTSSSHLYETSKRLLNRYHRDDKKILLLYLGDHDPSGIDMTRDVLDRTNLFMETDDIEVKRVALNMDQVKVLNPPENPAKITDSCFNGYRRKFGHSSWELDAIEPKALASLVTEEVLKVRDEEKWAVQLEKENKMKAAIHKAADKFMPRKKKK